MPTNKTGEQQLYIEELEKLVREVALALDDLLDKKPMLGAMRCGTMTLGNLRVEVQSVLLLQKTP